MKKLLFSLLVLYSSLSFSQTIEENINNTKNIDNVFYYKYKAVEQDSSLSTLVQRWGIEENTIVYWDTSIDFNIENISKFNEKAHLEKAQNLTQALEIVTQFIKIERPSLIKLQVCVYKENPTISIRPFNFSCN